MAAEERSLSLAEWLVLCLVCEEPRHGFAIARILGREGSMGQVWRVPKPVIYRALQRLELLGLVQTAQQQPSSQGPVRSLRLVPVADALRDRLATPGGFDRTLALWRYETVSATVRFLDAICAQAATR